MSGHFAHGQVATGTFEVPEEWLPLSKELASWVRKRTGALGISTGVYPGCSQEFGVPAAWYHANKEIVIDPEVALPGQDPRSVDFNDSLWQNENPRLFGLMHHELGHGMGTAYSGADYARFGARPREVDVIMALEEPKAELTAVEMSGQRSVRYLRHTALELILAEWSIPDGA